MCSPPNPAGFFFARTKPQPCPHNIPTWSAPWLDPVRTFGRPYPHLGATVSAPVCDRVRTLSRPCTHLGPRRSGPQFKRVRTSSRPCPDVGATVSALCSNAEHPPRCHSERSEESSWSFAAVHRNEARTGCFASLRMTNRPQRVEPGVLAGLVWPRRPLYRRTPPARARLSPKRSSRRARSPFEAFFYPVGDAGVHPHATQICFESASSFLT